MVTASLSLTQVFLRLLRRDLTLLLRRRGEAVAPLFFFLLILILFVMATGTNPTTMQKLAPGIVWVAALLAMLLGLEGLFRSDFADGSLEQLLLSGQPLSMLMLAKVVAHWLMAGLPLILVSPLFAYLLHMPVELTGVLIITLLLGTPVLSLLGAIGVALTLGLRQGGILLALLILPLYVPVLIFATQALALAADGLAVTAHLAILGACLAAALTLAPLAISAAIRIGMQ